MGMGFKNTSAVLIIKNGCIGFINVFLSAPEIWYIKSYARYSRRMAFWFGRDAQLSCKGYNLVNRL